MADDILPSRVIAEDTRYIDWLGRALFRHPDAVNLRKLLPEETGVALLNTESKWQVLVEDTQKVADAAAEDKIEQLRVSLPTEQGLPDPALEERIGKILDYRYPYGEACDFPVKWTVTEVQKSAYDRDHLQESFIMYDENEGKMDNDAALKRGSLLHLVLEKLNLSDVGTEGSDQKPTGNFM